MSLKLYLLSYDHIPMYVEAGSMAEAVELWKQVKRVEWGEDMQEGDEPESCALMHDEPVVRAGWLEREEEREVLGED